MKKLTALLLLCSSAAVGAPPTPSRIQRMASLLAAEDRRDPAGLAELLRDPDAGVRRRATLAAGRIGDRSLVPAIADRLADPIVDVRRVAAFALGLVGDASIVDRLTPALKDSDSIVRARAAEALGRLGDGRAAPLVAQMVLQAAPKGVAPIVVRGDDAGNPNDPWLEMRLGLFALAALKDEAASTSVLLESGRPRFDWWAATVLAAATSSDTVERVLIAGTESGDPLARAIAAGGLGHRRSPAAREALTKLTRDRDDDVAARALRALGEMRDAAVMPALLAALKDGNPPRKRAALEALVLVPGARAGEDVIALVGHEDPEMRAAALRLLARADHEALAMILSGLDPDPVWSVRAAVAEGLAGSGDEMAQGLLFGMLKDADPRMVAAALEALRVSQGAQSGLLLTQHLSHTDVGVRTVAARGLAALAQAGQARDVSRPLADAYRAAMRDADPEARLALVAALAAVRDDVAKETLRTAAAQDPDPAVRAYVRTIAAAGDAPAAVKNDRERPRLDYVLAMAPYDPAPDRPLYTPRAFLHTRRGVIEIHLNTLEAPLAVQTFLALARRGFFNEMELHRSVPGVRIEAGCPRGYGLGGPGFRIRREAGMKPFGRGAVGLDAGAKDTEGSRFFITLAPDPQRDGAATLLGTVVMGMDVVQQLRVGDVILWVEIWDGR